MGKVDGKVALVVGGALGIGRDCCALLASEGAKVAATDRFGDAGNGLAEEIAAAGGTAKFWLLDVTNKIEIEDVFSHISKTFGGLDALVINSGFACLNGEDRGVTDDEIRLIRAIDETGPALCIQCAIPFLKKRGGSIINLTSVYGIIGAPDAPPYRSEGESTRLMTKDELNDYSRNGIRVNAIHPAYARDIARGVLFLASDESKSVTATELR